MEGASTGGSYVSFDLDNSTYVYADIDGVAGVSVDDFAIQLVGGKTTGTTTTVGALA